MRDELSQHELKAFERLPRAKKPESDLYRRVVSQLKSENLIQTSPGKSKILRLIIQAAVAAILLLAGYFAGVTLSQSEGIDPQRGYVMILHEDETFTPGDPMDMFNEYRDWMVNLQERGMKITGQELKNEAILISRSETETEDTPVVRPERITGYFVMEAPTPEVAREVASACPHIRYGGTVELKEFMAR